MVKTSYSKHVEFFVTLALLVLGGASMCCPNVGHDIFHLMPDLGGFFFSLGQGDGCAQLD